MTNIPTELLRTLVTVVELRSFTKAAQSLGVTQPAVSAQIKRLQGLLGTELLDKSAPGVTLTSAGELVVNYARRLLSINDQILDFAAPRSASQTLRIGSAGDFTAGLGLRENVVHASPSSFAPVTGAKDSVPGDMPTGQGTSCRMPRSARHATATFHAATYTPYRQSQGSSLLLA